MKRSLFLVASLALAVPAVSQTGTFTTYGLGCGGTSGPCISANDSLPINLRAVTGASANFAIRSSSGGTIRLVTGFGFYTRTSNPSTTSVDCWIYSATAAGAPNAILASSTIQMTSTSTWQKTGQLKDPNGKNIALLTIPANTTFFLVFSNLQAKCNPLPIVTTGTRQTHFWRGPPTWSGPWGTQNWIYQVYCLGGSAAPKLSNTGIPTIAKSFSIDLSSAKANANSILSIGVGRTNVPLGGIGAPGCTFYTNPLILVIGQTSNAGTRKVNIPVPNDTTLVNFVFDSQYVVYDNANAMGLLWSEGGEAKIGR